MAIFKGAGVAIVTPMHADGSVNFEKLEETIDYQIENGTDSIVICGTTGESSTLSEEEHIECIRTAISRTAGNIHTCTTLYIIQNDRHICMLCNLCVMCRVVQV